MNPLLFGPIFDIIKQVLGGLGLDPEAKAKAQAQALDVLTNGTFDQKSAEALALAQIAVNQETAKTPGAHFRDGAGWVCVAGMAFPMVKVLVEWGATLAGHPVTLPTIDAAESTNMLWALLGLGSFHAAPAVVSAFKGGK